MEKFSFDGFQYVVDEVLVRHRSLLDILTKLQESISRVNRAVVKCATNCGCIEVQGKKQEIPKGVSFSESKNYMHSFVNGLLCETCKEKIEHELATNFFYITALCNVLDINVEDLLKNYYNNQLKPLGKYGLL
jgi:hypothetical protein